MIKTYRNIVNYLLPVFIRENAGVLTIVDGRPSTLQLIFSAGGIGLLIFTVFSLGALINSQFYGFIPILIGASLFLIIKALLAPFREIYIFDKNIDTYTLVRRSLVKSQTEQGSLSQFRAIQIERRLDDDGETSETFHIALLKNEGLLFGSPSRLILREGSSHPIFSNFSSESRIANAIEKFLDFSPTEVIDV